MFPVRFEFDSHLVAYLADVRLACAVLTRVVLDNAALLAVPHQVPICLEGHVEDFVSSKD